MIGTVSSRRPYRPLIDHEYITTVIEASELPEVRVSSFASGQISGPATTASSLSNENKSSKDHTPSNDTPSPPPGLLM